MDRQHWEKMLPIIQAFVDGKSIQYYSDYSLKWEDSGDTFEFSRNPALYRIKPETKLIKYRSALMRRMGDDQVIAIIWCEKSPYSQAELEADPKFVKWLEDTQTHEIEI